MAKALTARSVEGAKPGAVRREIADGGARGLHLVMQPSGAKSWAYRYVSPVTAKRAKLTLGPWPEISLADARRKAGDALRAVLDGKDPAAEKQQQRRAAVDRSDMVDVLLDQFAERYLRVENRQRTADEAERLIRLHIKPTWSGRKVQTITKRDVIALQERVAERAPIAANRTFAVVRRFFSWLIERDVVQVSPAAGMKRITAERSRDRVLSDDEIRLVWLATDGGGELAALVRLLLLLGQRRNEVAGMRWRELTGLDGTEPTWLLPAGRSKNGREHAVPLAPAAVAIIKALPRIERSEYVLTTNGTTPVSGFSKFKAALDRRMLSEAKRLAKESGEDPSKVELPDWRLHDLRRTVASGLARLGERIEVAEMVLNHRSGTFAGITAVYQKHDFAVEKRRALKTWAFEVDRIVAGQSSIENVLPFRSATVK